MPALVSRVSGIHVTLDDGQLRISDRRGRLHEVSLRWINTPWHFTPHPRQWYQYRVDDAFTLELFPQNERFTAQALLYERNSPNPRIVFDYFGVDAIEQFGDYITFHDSGEPVRPTRRVVSLREWGYDPPIEPLPPAFIDDLDPDC